VKPTNFRRKFTEGEEERKGKGNFELPGANERLALVLCSGIETMGERRAPREITGTGLQGSARLLHIAGSVGKNTPPAE